VTLLAGIICSYHGQRPNCHTTFIFKRHREQNRRIGFVPVSNRRDSSVMNTGFPEKVLQLLESVAETDEVRTNLELPLYESQVLDSIKTVELMVRIEEEFGLKVSPSEFERENWGTPRKIIADLESRAQVTV